MGYHDVSKHEYTVHFSNQDKHISLFKYLSFLCDKNIQNPSFWGGVPGIELRAMHMLGKCSTTELNPSPLLTFKIYSTSSLSSHPTVQWNTRIFSPNCNLVPTEQPFPIPPSPSTLSPTTPTLVTTILLSPSVRSMFLDPTCEWIMWHLSFCAWFISFNIVISISVHVVTSGTSHPFYCQIVFHCVYVLHYPLLS